MKKLLILAATVALAVGAHAAAVTWASGTIKYNGTSVAAKGNASLYILGTDAAAGNTYDSLISSLSADYAKAAAAIYNDALGGKYGSVKASGTTNKGAKTLGDGVDYSEGTSVYGLLVYTYNDGKADYVIANVGKTVVGPVDQQVTGMGTTLGGTAFGSTSIAFVSATSAVPEPTSGLLILLGMAGLALKRKRS